VGALLLVLGIAALGLPQQMLSGLAYAVQRGRIEADRDQLARLASIGQAFRLVARTARPGVVSIQVRAGKREREEWDNLLEEQKRLDERRRELERLLEDHADEPQDPELRSHMRDLLRDLRDLERQRAELQERMVGGTGSGIVYDAQGHILTNNHVVEKRSEILVRLYDEREFKATIVGTDPESDLALLKIDADRLHPLLFGDSDTLEVGDWVLSIGAPFGLEHTVTHGIVSARGRTNINTGRRTVIYQNFIQTDAAINPGNSGGPLLNLRGEVVGVNTAIATNGEAVNAGVAFAIPSNMAVKIAERLKRDGQVARGWLGVTMGELTPADREVLGLAGDRGVLVDGVLEGEPADEAGLRVEDVVLSINGTPVRNPSEMLGAVADVFPGETARLEIFRAGRIETFTIRLGRRPPAHERNAITVRRTLLLPGTNLEVRTLLPSRAEHAGHGADARGVVVWPADVAKPVEGLPPNRASLITECNGKAVRTAADLLGCVQGSDTVALTVLSEDGEPHAIEIAVNH